MKLLHLSDLHIGKQLNGYRLINNQEEILREIVDCVRRYRPDAILICGDIYDKSIPSGEAHTVFDRFLKDLGSIQPVIPVMIIAGNHDSPERLSYASAFLEEHQIYISVYPPKKEEQHLKKIVLQDSFGSVNFYLLPFLKPGYVRSLFPERQLETYEDAVRAVLEREKISEKERNVLLSHQFYTAGAWETQVCDSEEGSFSVGGIDRIPVEAVEAFDYVALGHLHGQQKVGKDMVRYSGTPYKYSVSEEHHKKGVLLVTLNGKNEPVQVEQLLLPATQDVRRVKGKLAEILETSEGEMCHDFVSITITDEEEAYDLREQLERVYDHILEIKIDNKRTRGKLQEPEQEIQERTPLEIFRKFYETVRQNSMTEEEECMMRQIIDEAGEVEV